MTLAHARPVIATQEAIQQPAKYRPEATKTLFPPYFPNKTTLVAVHITTLF
jgi:hypothetical protein